MRAALPMLFLLVACGSEKSARPAAIRDGLRCVYSADLDAAIDDEAQRITVELRATLVPPGIAESVTHTVSGIEVRPRATDRDATSTQIARDYPMLAPVACDALCYRITDVHAKSLRARALAQTIDVIRKRLAQAPTLGTATTDGEAIVVDLAAADLDAIATTEDLVARRAQLRMHFVDNDAPFMQALHARAIEDNIVEGATERWRVEAQPDDELDFFLTHPDRKTLETYVRDLAQRDPRLAIPADRMIGYGDARTYYLERTPIIDGSSITTAKTANADVIVQLDAAGTKALADASRKNIGRKVAILIDNYVGAAPILASALDRGAISITMRDARDADELARALRAGALPVPLRLETKRELRGGKVVEIE